MLLNWGMLPIPREHGAWAMLLAPFVSAAVVARQLTWELAPALVCVLGVFLLRQPLVVLWRQAAIWKEAHPETAGARAGLPVYGGMAAVSALLLFWRLPAVPLLVLGAGAAALTAVATWLTVHNRQRSVALQLVSAAGLNASALVAWLALRHELSRTAWELWGLQFVFSAATVLAVHAKLEAMRSKRPPHPWSAAMLGSAAAMAAAGVYAAQGAWWLAAALALAAGASLRELARLRHAQARAEPLRQVGLRTLAASLVFSILVVIGLRGY